MKLVNIHKPILVITFLLSIVSSINAQNWSLQQCIDTAQLNNKNLQIAQNNIALSNKKAKEAKANLLPKLMANADYKYFTNLPYQLLPLSTFNPAAPEGQFNEAQFGVPHNINANLQLAIPLYNSQIYGGIKARKIGTEMTELQYEKSREDIYFEIANLYYNGQILQAQLAFIDSNSVNANKLLRSLELLQEQLLVTGTDVGKIQLQVSQLSTRKSTIKSKLEQVLEALKFVIGIPSDQSFKIEQEITQNDELAYSYNSSIDARIILTQRKLLKTELNTLSKSRYLPNINFVGSYGTSGFGYDKEPNSFLNFYPIGFAGIQISYPIFNGSVSLRKIDQKRIELRNNELKTELVQDQNTMQIKNANLQLSSSQLAIETSNQQIQLAQNIYNNTILQQKQGVASLSDVLLADNTLREAQQTNLSAIVDYLKADLELKKLTGNI